MELARLWSIILNFKQYKIIKRIEEKKVSSLYCCYSLNLRDFLYKNGVKYELCALNPNSKNMFWVYIRNEKLNRLLDEWSNNK
jgi:hypothetical protein